MNTLLLMSFPADPRSSPLMSQSSPQHSPAAVIPTGQTSPVHSPLMSQASSPLIGGQNSPQPSPVMTNCSMGKPLNQAFGCNTCVASKSG